MGNCIKSYRTGSSKDSICSAWLGIVEFLGSGEEWVSIGGEHWCLLIGSDSANPGHCLEDELFSISLRASILLDSLLPGSHTLFTC